MGSGAESLYRYDRSQDFGSHRSSFQRSSIPTPSIIQEVEWRDPKLHKTNSFQSSGPRRLPRDETGLSINGAVESTAATTKAGIPFLCWGVLCVTRSLFVRTRGTVSIGAEDAEPWYMRAACGTECGGSGVRVRLGLLSDSVPNASGEVRFTEF